MDLTSLAITKSDDGIEYEIRDLSGGPTGIFFSMIGADSGEYQNFIRKYQNRRMQARRYSPPTIEEIDNMSLQALCKAAIKGWRTGDEKFITVDGEKLAFSPENAMKILGDSRFKDIREQCQEVIDNRKNFLA